MDNTQIDLQNKEFDAVAKLAEQYRRVTLTPVVDDDYSEVRHDYECTLGSLVIALRDNGRLHPQDYQAQDPRSPPEEGPSPTPAASKPDAIYLRMLERIIDLSKGLVDISMGTEPYAREIAIKALEKGWQ